MNCPHCQAPNAEEARFCGVCGRATSMTEPASNPDLGQGPQLIGRVIAGRYRILEKLGEGGMGAVYQAEQISLKRTVAIKLLRPDVSASPMLLRRFNAEAEAVAKLRHPNTVNIYDFGQDTDGALFIAMELIEGRSLRSVVHREAPLPPRRALAIAAQVAASLADAHGKTIIHRDLKPDNVMLTDRGRTKDNVTVLDFGIAKLRDDSRATQQQMTQAGDMLGTPQYMAPEQIRGEPIDGRTDIYALGGMIYEMITARLPHEAPTVMALLSKHLLEQAPPPSQRRPELGIPPAVDELVMTAMAKDPAARPPTMEEFGERIAAVLATLPAEATAQRSAVVGIPHADTPPAFSAAGAFSPPTPGPQAPPRSGSPTPPPPLGPSGPHAAPAPYGGPPPYGAPPPAPYGAPPPSAPYAHAPYAGPPQGGPPPHPGPYAHGPAPSSGGSKMMWALVAVLLLGGGGAGIYFATRGKGSKTADTREVERDKPDRDKDDPDKDDLDRPDPDRGKPDRWDRRPDAAVDHDDGDEGDDDPVGHDHPSAAPVAGKTVDVAQGVKIIVPPGMSVRRLNGGVLIGDLKKLAILAFPITAASNDADELARLHGKEFGLQLQKSEVTLVAGAMRTIYGFEGTLDGKPVVQVAVPLLGPGYRVGVVVHATVAAVMANPAGVQALMTEVLAQRIVVPSGNH